MAGRHAGEGSHVPMIMGAVSLPRLRPYGADVRRPLTFDDVEELEFTARSPQDHRAAAAILTGWAEEQHPDDDVTPAALLAAAWHLDAAGDPDAALELHRRTVAMAGNVPPDARVYLHGALLNAGRDDEARQVADDLRRSRPADPDVYTFMAENHERAGDLRQAHRWVEMGATRLDLADAEDVLGNTGATELLLQTRRRIRQGRGFPPDARDSLVPPPLEEPSQ